MIELKRTNLPSQTQVTHVACLIKRTTTKTYTKAKTIQMTETKMAF